MKLQEAKDIMISLGRAGKMPCPTYNTPAKLCKTGSKLRKVKGTTCHGCYAMKGNYLFPTVQQGLQKRFAAFKHPRFVDAITFMVNRYSAKSGYFRWFDSGDIALLVRVSSPMIDGEPLKFDYTSTVHHNKQAIGHDCPSRFQDNECRDCRACWNKEVKNVSYHKH